MFFVLGTNNSKKTREFISLLRGQKSVLKGQEGVEIFSSDPLDFPPETGKTYLENALIKARHAAATCGMFAIGEDSGIEVAGLNGWPGLHSARWSRFREEVVKRAIARRTAFDPELLEEKETLSRESRDVKNNALLLRLLEGKHGDDRLMHYVSSLVIVNPKGTVLFHTEARMGGRVLHQPQECPAGGTGFGYDPIVAPHISPGRSLAEGIADTKNFVSHRRQATDEFLRWYGALPPSVINDLFSV